MKKMTFSDYSAAAQETAVYPNRVSSDGLPSNLLYPLVGLAGESGEVMEFLKKRVLRDEYAYEGNRPDNDGTVFTEEQRLEILHELGDVLWYISESAFQLGSTLEEVATMNVAKLQLRHANRGISAE